MLDLESAIKHCEEVAESCERGNPKKRSKSKCASEHRQLAEWLKELAKYREIFNKIGEILNEYGYTIDDLDTIFGKANDEEVNADEGNT